VNPRDRFNVRHVRPEDAEPLRAIYNLEVTETTVTFDLVPRTPADQEQWIEEHTGAYPALVAVDQEGGALVGFASLSPYRPRPAYATTVEDSVYIHRSYQGQGVGRLLLGSIVDVAGTGGFHAVIARIVGGHDASIGLHRACGFDFIGVEREVGRKFGKWLDVAIMQRLL
jgi:L-amino acid N-acyltransferase